MVKYYEYKRPITNAIYNIHIHDRYMQSLIHLTKNHPGGEDRDTYLQFYDFVIFRENIYPCANI